jgi:hypothetical protein
MADPLSARVLSQIVQSRSDDPPAAVLCFAPLREDFNWAAMDEATDQVPRILVYFPERAAPESGVVDDWLRQNRVLAAVVEQEGRLTLHTR